MESRNVQNFIEDAGKFLPLIRSGILLCGQEGGSGGELEVLLPYTAAIKNASSAHSLHDIAAAADLLGQAISDMASTREALSNEQTRNLLDKLAALEALLAKLHFTGENFSVNLDGFVEEAFENLPIAQTNQSFSSVPVAKTLSPAKTREDEFEGFEIDAEMLEIFRMEAEQLLESISSHLKILESAPNDREALLEIRRNAHTLKGSAGIIGLKPLSDLAHRVEDLLDFLSENKVEGSRQIFELLSASTDSLNALAAGENSPQLSDRIENLYQRYEITLLRLQTEKEHGGKKVQSDENELRRFLRTTDRIEPPAGEPSKTKEESQPPKVVIRVSLEKLNELGRLVSDLIIARSVFERRLAEFERQLGELQHSTERLKRSTGKLETDFEANTLSVPSSGFGIPDSKFQIPSSVRVSNRSALEFDALEFDRYTEFHQMTRELFEATRDAAAVSSELDNVCGNLELLFDNQRRLIEEMQDKLLRLRMIQFGTIAPRLQRTVSVTCEEENKRAELVIEGDQTEIDTQILNSLAEPLLHLLRNAIAHGIESPDTRRLLGKPEKGKIILRIQSEGTHVVLTVADDGRGISAPALKEKAVRDHFITAAETEKMSDEQAFELSFLPGLTTAETVRQTAGRGVGMNIVKNSLARQQGTISIASEPQKGATFTIRLPLPLAVTRGLLIKANGQIFALPLKLVKQVSAISAETLDQLKDKTSFTLDGVDYALSTLEALLGLPASKAKQENIPILLFDNLEAPCAVMIEEILKAEEIVIKPLGSPLRNFPYLLGATILGDGRVVPVLDSIYLIKNKIQSSRSEIQTPSGGKVEQCAGGPPSSANEDRRAALRSEQRSVIKVMIVDDSPSVRHITSKLVKNAGFEVMLAKDGLEALEMLQADEVLPDVVLTDAEMPRMDGYEMVGALKNEETLKTIPVVMITSRASAKHRQKAFEVGVAQYLTKPFDETILVETIVNLAKTKVDSFEPRPVS